MFPVLTRWRRFSGLILLGVSLAACQARPAVFRDGLAGTGTRPDLADIYSASGLDAHGIFVAGVAEAPAEFDQALREAVVQHLAALDIAASAQSANRETVILETIFNHGGAGAPSLTWRLVDADDMVVGLMDQEIPGGRAAWWYGGPTLAAELAAQAAPRLAALIRDAPAPPAEAAPMAAVSVAVAGAPGDGDKALADAVRAALVRAGFALAPAGPGVLHLLGAVTRRAGGINDVVAIHWQVAAADGVEVGAIDQNGAVLAGSLDRVWGAVADRIAEGAVSGLAELLAEAAARGRPSAR